MLILMAWGPVVNKVLPITFWHQFTTNFHVPCGPKPPGCRPNSWHSERVLFVLRVGRVVKICKEPSFL